MKYPGIPIRVESRVEAPGFSRVNGSTHERPSGLGLYRRNLPKLSCLDYAPLMHRAAQELRTFFITTVTANRRRIFQVSMNAELLLDSFEVDRSKGRYQLHAFAIMTDHIHLLITPAPDISVEKVMQFLKGGYSFRLKSKLDVWQKGFTKHRIEDNLDYANHLKYIHENPVRAGLCQQVEDFMHSSANGRFAVDPAPKHLEPHA